MEGELTYEIKTRIESELEVKAYLQNLRFALNNGQRLIFRSKDMWIRTEMKDIQISIQSICYFQMKIR